MGPAMGQPWGQAGLGLWLTPQHCRSRARYASVLCKMTIQCPARDLYIYVYSEFAGSATGTDWESNYARTFYVYRTRKLMCPTGENLNLQKNRRIFGDDGVILRFDDAHVVRSRKKYFLNYVTQRRGVEH